MVQRMERQDPPRCVLALSDSDHAGCLRTRRSTTCNILMHGDHFLKMICSTQVPIALSSGESEWYALTHSGCAVIGLKNLCRDTGQDLAAHTAGDASAARRGRGKIRHLETRTLWLQRHLRRQKGSENTSDLGTKHLDQATMWKHVAACCFEKRDGKSELSLRAAL